MSTLSLGSGGTETGREPWPASSSAPPPRLPQPSLRRNCPPQAPGATGVKARPPQGLRPADLPRGHGPRCPPGPRHRHPPCSPGQASRWKSRECCPLPRLASVSPLVTTAPRLANGPGRMAQPQLCLALHPVSRGPRVREAGARAPGPRPPPHAGRPTHHPPHLGRHVVAELPFDRGLSWLAGHGGPGHLHVRPGARAAGAPHSERSVGRAGHRACGSGQRAPMAPGRALLGGASKGVPRLSWGARAAGSAGQGGRGAEALI